jgi:hypothetical protein
MCLATFFIRWHFFPFTGGWHHVEVHPDSWWNRKFESYGFKYDQELTMQARKWAEEDRLNTTNIAPNGKPFDPQHLRTSLKVYVNHAVAALPKHQHLFPEHGCFLKFNGSVPRGHSAIFNRPCGQGDFVGADVETVLPDSYEPLPVLPEMHQRWHDYIKRILQQK